VKSLEEDTSSRGALGKLTALSPANYKSILMPVVAVSNSANHNAARFSRTPLGGRLTLLEYEVPVQQAQFLHDEPPSTEPIYNQLSATTLFALVANHVNSFSKEEKMI